MVKADAEATRARATERRNMAGRGTLVGDKIMFREPSSFENRKMKVSDVDYYVISVNDVLAKVN